MEVIHNQCHFTNNCSPAQGAKKKYSKVNEEIRQQFLQCIIQKNMSIKQASQNLNINYSSAKAILAQHRRTLISSHRLTVKGSQQAGFRTLTPLQSYFVAVREVVCSTGGKEVSRCSGCPKTKPIHKTTFILMGVGKDHDSNDNTENSRDHEA